MIFEIEKVSVVDEKPCDEAKLMTRVETRKMSKYLFEKIVGESTRIEWYQTGFNHKETDTHVLREVENQVWFIELKSLEELTEFVKKYGKIIVEKNEYGDKITIYDDYIE